MPTKDIIELPMSPDDAAKLVMSAGLIQPGGQATLAALAQAARQPRVWVVEAVGEDARLGLV